MPIADKKTYLAGLVNLLKQQWPNNRTINIVCHGHSVVAGYFATPFVDTFNSYPHLFHKKLKERFPFAVINVIVTAIGGENSISGAKRFSSDVLTHRPDLVLTDYGLNDRTLDAESVRNAWKKMVREARQQKVPVLLLTPSWDFSVLDKKDERGKLLKQRAGLIKKIASEEKVGLVDVYSAFESAVISGVPFESLMSWTNHPSRLGHEIIANEIISWFSS
ncbi:MAG: SGNH/GDSL hydrolase family protein [Candidatus Omnitrophica bacterium]|nr:SGNH/GDSL hydrolase family protein [Candidatus Omnitrophota bacterium]